MSIENEITRQATALERIANALELLLTAAGKAQAAAPNEPVVESPKAPPAPPAVVTVGTIPQQAPPRGRGRPAKTQTTEQTSPATTPAAAAPATAPAVAAAPVTPGTSPPPSVLGELSEKIQILANTPGKLPAAVAILKGFHGALRVSELKPEEYASALEQVKAALNTISLI
jgi:hypothetical protein